MSSLMVTTFAPVYAGECKEKEHSPKSAASAKKIVTEDDVYAQNIKKVYTPTIASACEQAADELAVCNIAMLTIVGTNSRTKQQLAKVPLIHAFMQAQKLYTDQKTPYTYSTATIPELFAHIAPKLLHDNQQSPWTTHVGLTRENNDAYDAITEGVDIKLETMTRCRGQKIKQNYTHTHTAHKKD